MHVDAAEHKVPYSGRVWRVENLVNLANCLWFAKVKSFKLLLITISNLLHNLFIY